MSTPAAFHETPSAPARLPQRPAVACKHRLVAPQARDILPQSKGPSYLVGGHLWRLHKEVGGLEPGQMGVDGNEETAPAMRFLNQVPGRIRNCRGGAERGGGGCGGLGGAQRWVWSRGGPG